MSRLIHAMRFFGLIGCQSLGVTLMWSTFSDAIISNHKKTTFIADHHPLNLWRIHHNRKVIGLQLCAINFKSSRKKSLIGTWNFLFYYPDLAGKAAGRRKKFRFYFFWSNFELFMTGGDSDGGDGSGGGGGGGSNRMRLHYEPNQLQRLQRIVVSFTTKFFRKLLLTYFFMIHSFIRGKEINKFWCHSMW